MDEIENTVRDMDAEYAELKRKVDEIHEFCQSLSIALQGLEKNPMIRTMLGM